MSSDLSTALLGTVAGMQARENPDGTMEFTIRGIGTLYADRQPLVVVDGFPIASGFRDINPNDVESVTVLKDAAAASIWGARAGNGVIVVTTKSGRERGERLSVDITSMVRIGTKMDLSVVVPTASSRAQVDYEQFYFENDLIFTRYTGAFDQLGSSLSFATELLWAHARGQISLAERNQGLDRLRAIDNTGQIRDLLLQNPVWNQQNIAISRASDRGSHRMSLMYENQIGNVINNGSNRWRVNYTNQTSIFRWLDFNFQTNIHYVNSTTGGPTVAEMRALSPYEMILNPEIANNWLPYPQEFCLMMTGTIIFCVKCELVISDRQI
jgi:TonB-dependent SusC/RagA subfamily outer membrane receptor